MDLTFGGILLLGLVIGLQHALEADHVAAVSSIVTGETTMRRIVAHGALWGLGHTIMLGIVAGTAIYVGTGIDESIAGWLEFGVGVMLVLLGGQVIWRMVRDRIHFHAHRHNDGTVHMHAHSHAGEQAPHNRNAHAHEHPQGLPWRTLTVGLMHGMAGSAALVVLTATSVSDPLLGIGYVVIFGLGSIAGMAALSAVIALPLGYTARTLTWANRALQGGIGVATAVLGCAVMYETQLHLLFPS
ncbi:MAG: high frequency lysogenization protein HflD [Rhodospirillales bacterium]|nr:high frequency lysogenization protein HflD [Rhodospirillales bacterium]MBO6788456.1 high frequency lysogenization protein HflD [Rhodospirillales bacterium]